MSQEVVRLRVEVKRLEHLRGILGDVLEERGLGPVERGGYEGSLVGEGKVEARAGSGARSGVPLSPPCGERVCRPLRTSRRIVTARSLACEGPKQARSARWRAIFRKDPATAEEMRLHYYGNIALQNPSTPSLASIVFGDGE